MRPSEELKELGIEIPEVAAPVAAYVPAVQTGNLVFTAGQIPFVSGTLAFQGTVGKDVTTEQGAEAAGICALNALAAVKSVCGDLDKITRVVKLTGFVQCTAEYKDQAKVMNGASELLVKIFGDKGKHARCALGANSLPLDAPVELDLVVEIEL